MKKAFCTMLVLAVCLMVPLAVYAGETPEGVFTIAGTGTHGVLDGTDAQFNMPFAIAGDALGNILVADTFNNLIRVINSEGETSIFAGQISESGFDGFPLGGLRDGLRMDALFNRPSNIAVNQQGWIFVADTDNHAIRVIVDQNVYTAAGGSGHGHADGHRLDALFNYPSAIAFCPAGNLYIADTGNHVVRRLDPQGNVTTVAGIPGEFGFENGIASSALFDSPAGIIVSQTGRVYVADTGNHLIRVLENGGVSTLAGIYELQYVDEWGYSPVGGFADGGAAVARFSHPSGLALFDGMLIIADSGNHRLRVVNADGYVLTLTGSGEPGFLNAVADVALFHSPVGVYVIGDLLIVADSGNNMIRGISLEFFEWEVE